MTVLTRTYCVFCEVVKELFNTFKKPITSTFDRKVYNTLTSFTDRELQDIGICRGDIYTIANSKSMSDYSDKISTKVVPNSNIKGWV